MMDSSQQSSTTQAPGVARRRLIRAGLSAAPVLAAVKTNSVLAGDNTCIRPSSFSSLTAARMKVSQGRSFNTNFECESPSYWRGRKTGLPPGFKDTKFISDTTGFKTNPQGKYRNLSLQDVLDGGSDKHNAELARYVVASYLTAIVYRTQPSRLLLNTGQCVAIWNGQGNWSPFAGANWNLNQTMAYFDKIYGRPFL